LTKYKKTLKARKILSKTKTSR